MLTDFRVSIVGGGSVGLCLAANFAIADAKVSLFVRKASLASLEGQPVIVSGMLGEHRTDPGQITFCDAAAPSDEVLTSDMLVLTTKAYDVATALEPFASAPSCPPVLLLQNGMGSAEIARKILGEKVPVFSSAMMIGMERKSPNSVHIAAQASPIQCGPLLGDDPAPLQRLIDCAEQGFVPMTVDPNIRETIAFKLLFNCCMNPTGAITGQTYGELLADPNSRALIVDLADEALAAFAAAFDYHPATSGQHYVDDILTPIVVPRGEGHRSSMLQDLQSGRKTEIDFLNGAIIDLSEQNGLDAVRHKMLTQLIKASE